MDGLPTPRRMPANLECWSDEIEELLSEWAEVSMCYSYLHNYSTRKYKKKYHHLQIPIIVLSTLTGTANFATDSYVPKDFQHGFSAGVGALNGLSKGLPEGIVFIPDKSSLSKLK